MGTGKKGGKFPLLVQSSYYPLQKGEVGGGRVGGVHGIGESPHVNIPEQSQIVDTS